MNDGNARQQIVESIKKNSNILVTVSTDPTVDELSAALGLTIMLNNMDKRATAVVSGDLPPAITFLEPDKTFEHTVNSLRDFIIALDKEKADHLRYKVDGDVVKIFITPYRTELTQEDLEFSSGDYNVELVIALGVKDQDHLDKALAAHGRIFHDATVVAISTGSEPSKLGSVDWRDGEASSLSEMLVSLSDALKDDKPLLDEQIATAFLTGIVSATDRFSNERTSSRVMTMAAQLMAAGANQQLIAAKLEEAHDIGPNAPAKVPETPAAAASDAAPQAEEEVLDLADNRSLRIDKKRRRGPKPAPTEKEAVSAPVDAGQSALDAAIAATAAATATNVAMEADALEQPAPEALAPAEPVAPVAAAVPAETPEMTAEQALDNQLAGLATPDINESLKSIQDELRANPQPEVAAAQPEPTSVAPAPVDTPQPAPAPIVPPLPELPPLEPTPAAVPASDDGMPGFEPMEVPAAPTPESNDASPIAGHARGYLSEKETSSDEPAGVVEEGLKQDGGFAAGAAKTINPFSEPLPPLPTPPVTTSPLDQNVFNQLDEQAPVVPELTQSEIPNVEVTPQIPELTPLPPLPDFSTLPPAPTPPADGFAPSGPVSSDQLGDIFGPPPTAPPPPPPTAPPAPGQFRIPGQ